METVELKLDESNALVFEVKIDGDAKAIPHYRLMCQFENISYAFDGTSTDDGVRFEIPKLESIQPGTYDTHLEVIIENKLFVPMQFKTKFDVSTKVVAESVKVVTNQVKQNVVASIKTQNISTQKIEESKKGLTLREVYEARSKKK
jgi:hypothetical protein